MARTPMSALSRLRMCRTRVWWTRRARLTWGYCGICSVSARNKRYHFATPAKFSLLTKFLAVSGELLGRQIDALAVVLDHSADDLRAPAVALQNGEHCVAILFGDENTKPDPHIVDLEHLGIADRSVLLNQAENRRYRRQVVNLKSDCRVDAGEVQQTISGYVDQRFYGRHLLDDVEDFANIDEGRAKQRLAHLNAQLGEDVVDRQPGALEKCVARQSQTVAVDPAAFEADNDVTRRQVAAGDDAVERHDPDRHPDQ